MSDHERGAISVARQGAESALGARQLEIGGSAQGIAEPAGGGVAVVRWGPDGFRSSSAFAAAISGRALGCRTSWRRIASP